MRAEKGFVMKETVTVITTLNVLVPCFVVKITALGVTEMIVVCSQVYIFNLFFTFCYTVHVTGHYFYFRDVGYWSSMWCTISTSRWNS